MDPQFVIIILVVVSVLILGIENSLLVRAAGVLVRNQE